MPLPENHNKPSTRHLVVDHRFATLLSEDFGITRDVILDALEGEPQKQAISILTWAEKTDDPARALVAWAKKHNRGRCRRAARTTTERPARRHGGGREQQDERRRGTAPDTERGIDPAFVRANVARMRG